ncbi:MAG: GntR family transcriptional regulator [Eubacterium sp.]
MKTTLLYLDIQKEITSLFSDMDYYSPLPSERELSQMFNVSRPTIRKALENLEHDNMILRIQGKGAFYIGNKVSINHSNSENHGLGLFSILTSAGKITKNHVLQQIIEEPTPDISTYLNLKKGDLIFHLKRLRYVNDALYSLDDDYIPLHICPNLIDTDFTDHSLFETFKENNIIPSKEDKNIEFRRSDLQESAYLKLKKRHPVSVTRILSYDNDERIIQYGTSIADAYKSRFQIVSTINPPHNDD